MKANEVTIGTRLWKHGHQWEVKAIRFDQRGNASTRDPDMPRFLFDVLAVDCSTLPRGYHYTTLGYLPDAEVTR